jgi:hypothetical protein
MALCVHFDTNVIDHAYRGQCGITAAVLDKIREAARAARLLVPASPFTAQELLSTATRSREDAYALGTLYLELASLDHAVKAPRELLRDAVHAYAYGGSSPSPFVVLSAAQKERWRGVTATGSTPELTDSWATEARDVALNEHDSMAARWATVQKDRAEEEARGGVIPPFDVALRELWPTLSVYYATAHAAGYGDETRARCEEKGIPGLLHDRVILASVGIFVCQIVVQMVKKRAPETGDLVDRFHVATAAALGCPLVTHDDRLRELIRAIPGLSIELLTATELAARL